MEDLSNYGIYAIQCAAATTRDAGYLHVRRATLAPVELSVWTFDRTRWAAQYGNRHFHWMLVGAGEPGHFYIASRHSGLCLRRRPPVKDGARPVVWLDRYDAASDAEFRFEIAPATGGAGDVCTLRCSATGDALSVATTADATIVEAQPEPYDDKAHPLFSFRFELVEKGLAPPDPVMPPVPAVRGLPHVTTLDQALPRSVRPIEGPIARDVLPFFLVNDVGLARFRQVEESPWYSVELGERWDRVLDRQFDGFASRQTTETRAIGLTVSDAASVRETFSWSVETTVEGSVQSGPWSASASVTARVASEAERNRQHGEERRQERTRSESVTYPELQRPYRVVTWAPVDVFELRRSDGHVVRTWAVARDGEDVTELFQAPTPRRKPTTG